MFVHKYRRHYAKVVELRLLRLTCRQHFESRITHVDRYVVLVPGDGRLGVAGSVADHHRVAILLDRFQSRVLNDARITARYCSSNDNINIGKKSIFRLFIENITRNII